MENLKTIFSNTWAINIISGLAIALILFLISLLYKTIANRTNENKIFNWLKQNTEDKAGKQFKSISDISKGTGIRTSKAQVICELHNKIYQDKNEEGHWGIFGDESKSVYEERGLIEL
ncbi:MAG: hypothetical protein ACYSUT_04325 [Planctomycetota bacterium]